MELITLNMVDSEFSSFKNLANLGHVFSMGVHQNLDMEFLRTWFSGHKFFWSKFGKFSSMKKKHLVTVEEAIYLRDFQFNQET
jgi:hypothetical protein